MTTYQEKKKYAQFVKDVRKREMISIDELWMLLNRHTQGNMGRRFFNNSLKLNYYKFWIKRIEGAGIIKQTKYVSMWEVSPEW